jgi:hypothetical protein
MIYPGSGPSLEVIALRQWFDIEDEHVLQRDEHRAQESSHGEGRNGDCAPTG